MARLGRAAPNYQRARPVTIFSAGGTTTPLSITASGVGVVAITKQLSFVRAVSATTTGSAVITKILSLNKTISAIATSVATITKASTVGRVISAIAVGIATITKTFIPFVPGTGVSKSQKLILFLNDEDDDL